MPAAIALSRVTHMGPFHLEKREGLEHISVWINLRRMNSAVEKGDWYTVKTILSNSSNSELWFDATISSALKNSDLAVWVAINAPSTDIGKGKHSLRKLAIEALIQFGRFSAVGDLLEGYGIPDEVRQYGIKELAKVTRTELEMAERSEKISPKGLDALIHYGSEECARFALDRLLEGKKWTKLDLIFRTIFGSRERCERLHEYGKERFKQVVTVDQVKETLKSAVSKKHHILPIIGDLLVFQKYGSEQVSALASERLEQIYAYERAQLSFQNQQRDFAKSITEAFYPRENRDRRDATD